MPRQEYAKWDYENFDGEGLAPFVEALKRQKMGVVDVEGSNKSVRAGGSQTKKAVIVLRNGQSIMLQVTAQGAVFQVRLNNRIVGVKATNDISAIAKELGMLVRKNQPKFDAKMAKLAEKQEKTEPAPRKRALSVRKRLEELTTSISPLESRRDKLRNKSNALLSTRDSHTSNQQQQSEVLKDLQRENNELLEQISALEEL